jgi:alanine racemase
VIAVADPRRGAWVEVHRCAVATNVGVLAETVAPAALWVVVKADGYGHGAAAVARAALEAGAEGLCVAFVQEGVALRQSGILAPILVLSEQPAAQLDELVRWHLTATAYTPEYLDALAKEARETASPTVRVHLKVDTGMHRVGARPEQIVPLVQALLPCAICFVRKSIYIRTVSSVMKAAQNPRCKIPISSPEFLSQHE